MKTRTIAAVVVTAIVIFLGCAGNTVRYYAVEYDVEQVGVKAEDDKTMASKEVKDLLARSRTVAFYPPDSCLDIKAASTEAKEINKMMRLTCGVLMARLEAEATNAGFNVVSWQALRGKDRPIEYAKAHNVDLLFEVNELGFNMTPQDTYSVSTIRFYEDYEDSARVPVRVADVKKVATRCQNVLFNYLATSELYGLSVTLDLKMVSVPDGQVHWYHLQTRGDDSFVKEPRVYFYTTLVEQEPEETVCIAANASYGAPKITFEAAEEAGPSGTQYKFESEVEVVENDLLKTRERLVAATISGFISELMKMKSGGSAAPTGAPQL